MSSPNEFDVVTTAIDRLVALVENRYQTTNATAAECPLQKLLVARGKITVEQK